MTKKISKNVLRYNALFEPADEGGYTVIVPKLPGLVTEGDTFEDALRMAKDAIVGYLETSKKLGEETPEPDENIISTQIDIRKSKDKFIPL